MKETKFIDVKPSEVESTIELWQNFGWELMGAPQEIFNKNSHLELRNDTQYSVTETTHYVKITFQRDKEMPNYYELARLENKFHGIDVKPYSSIPSEPTKNLPNSCLGTVVGIGALLLMFSVIGVFVESGNVTVGITAGALIAAFGIFMLTSGRRSGKRTYSKRMEDWKKQCEDIENANKEQERLLLEKTEAYNQARDIINQRK